MSVNVTAKVKLDRKAEFFSGSDDEKVLDQVGLYFSADYADGRNKEWAKYTPTLTISMTVLPEVAAHFLEGQAWTLTFSPGSGDEWTSAGD